MEVMTFVAVSYTHLSERGNGNVHVLSGPCLYRGFLFPLVAHRVHFSLLKAIRTRQKQGTYRPWAVAAGICLPLSLLGAIAASDMLSA